MVRVCASESRPGPVPAVLGRLLAPLYTWEINRRNRAFDRGRGVTRLPMPVISVGNMSVGGTGKTPMVMHIIRALLGAGQQPCIAMRGYRRKGTGEADETDAYRRAFPDVPIVAQPDRLAGLQQLFARGVRPTCVVLDDGFQHRRIARDLDIVLIDATRSPFDDHLLPHGWLREPVTSLLRADLVVLTHAEMADSVVVDALDDQVAGVRRQVHPGRDGIDAVARHLWTGLVEGADDRRVLPLDWVLGKRLIASCAIGNPRGFLHSLQALLESDQSRPGSLAATLVLPDHDPYGPEMVHTLRRMVQEQRADAIIVTDKDWSKLRRVPTDRWGGVPIIRPHLEMGFLRGREAFDRRVLEVARSGRR